VLSWACNNTKKLGLEGEYECWTLISTPQYGKANKVPQENVPPAVAEKVRDEMWDELLRTPGVRCDAAWPDLAWRAQLWGAALPLNSPRTPYILNAEARLAVCGDWLTGAAVQDAVLSGAAAAEAIASERLHDHGLHSKFRPLQEGAAIGEFPAPAFTPADAL